MEHRVALVALLLSALPSWAADTAWMEVQGGGWSPSAALLRDLETRLSATIPAASRNRGHIPDWKSYTFQYQGQITLMGHRYVRVNGFCDSRANHANVNAAWVSVLDGGACFFSAKYDVEQKRLYEVLVNGVA